MSEFKHEGETWDDLLRDNMGVIQPVSGYRFSMDAVLLAHFAAQLPAHRVLDLGTGCGVIALLLASRLPTAEITGIEIQAEQADRAERSVRANSLQHRVTIIAEDLRAADLLIDHHYDLITANPPFFPRGRGKLPIQDSITISRHEVMCTLADLFTAAARWLSPDGRFCLILPPYREEEASALALKAGMQPSRIREVCPRAKRRANLKLLEFVPLDKITDLAVLPPLIVYQMDGNYTAEINSIYFDP